MNSDMPLLSFEKGEEVIEMRGRGMAFMLGRASARSKIQEPQEQNVSTSELEELADLHDKGILTDDEFSVAKKKVLSGK